MNTSQRGAPSTQSVKDEFRHLLQSQKEDVCAFVHGLFVPLCPDAHR